MAEICVISGTEANAAAAERRTIDRFAATLFETRLGETVDGVIVAIASFGAFVRIDDGAADGYCRFVPCPMIFTITIIIRTFRGPTYGWVFAAGDELKVKITEVTAVSGGILLDWVDGGRIDKNPTQSMHRRGDHHHQPLEKGESNDQANQKDANPGLTFCGFNAVCRQFVTAEILV